MSQNGKVYVYDKVWFTGIFHNGMTLILTLKGNWTDPQIVLVCVSLKLPKIQTISGSTTNSFQVIS